MNKPKNSINNKKKSKRISFYAKKSVDSSLKNLNSNKKQSHNSSTGYFKIYDNVCIFKNIKNRKIHIYTVNLDEGNSVYGEKLIKIKKELFVLEKNNPFCFSKYSNKNYVELREWIPYKSKLGAAVVLGIKNIGLSTGAKVLYLGSASGTTLSHVSDLVGENGIVYGVDISPVVLKKLYLLSLRRKNIIPILEDAFHPERYESIVSNIDFLFEDVSQKSQVDIFIKNAKRYLKDGGIGMIAVKSRSIDVTKNPLEIYRNVRKKLANYCSILEFKRLDYYEKDHALFICKF